MYLAAQRDPDPVWGPIFRAEYPSPDIEYYKGMHWYTFDGFVWEYRGWGNYKKVGYISFLD